MALSDEEYLRALALPETERQMLLSIRRSFAKECGIPEVDILPSMSLWDIAQMFGGFQDGWDALSFLLSLETVSGQRFNSKSSELPVFGPPLLTLSDWIKAAVPVLESTRI